MNARGSNSKNKMSLSHHAKSARPFMSVLLIIVSLFGLVFLKMEERRMSYDILRLSRTYKKNVEVKKQKEIDLAKLSRPQYVETIAKSRLTLKKAQNKQIIHLTSVLPLSMNR